MRPARRWRRRKRASTTSPSRAASEPPRTCASTSGAPCAPRQRRIAARSQAEYARAMEFVAREPHPSLRHDFEHYVGFEERSGAPVSRLEVPFAGAALIISLGNRWRMNGAFERDSFIAGVHDRPTLVTHDGYACCLEIHFTPLGARRFLGIPGSEL